MAKPAVTYLPVVYCPTVLQNSGECKNGFTCMSISTFGVRLPHPNLNSDDCHEENLNDKNESMRDVMQYTRLQNSSSVCYAPVAGYVDRMQFDGSPTLAATHFCFSRCAIRSARSASFFTLPTIFAVFVPGINFLGFARYSNRFSFVHTISDNTSATS